MRTLKKFPSALTDNIKPLIKEGAEELRAEISANAPRDTGQLANDADAVISRDGLSANVGYDESASGFKREWKKHGFLAVFHEYGTVKMPARPFVRPAYRKMLPKILADIKAAVTASLEKASNGGF
jgi:HK97 gp10 family phage protein